jgi:hypothetical protein
LTGTDKYFILNSPDIIINGNGYDITILDTSDYPGLINNGTFSLIPGYLNILIQNIHINSDNSSLGQFGGWIGQIGFGNGVTPITDSPCYMPPPGIIENTIFIENCHNNGDISNFDGGICGAFTGLNQIGGNILVKCCSSIGQIGDVGGGIYGGFTGQNQAGGNILAKCCYSIGQIGDFGGGIYGGVTGQEQTGGNILAKCCYSIGQIGDFGGGIYGGIVGQEQTGGNILAECCYSIGQINDFAGGIYGAGTGSGSPIAENISAEYCYVIGECIGSPCGDISGIQSNVTELNNELTEQWEDAVALDTIGTRCPDQWIDIDERDCYPWLLNECNQEIYEPNFLTTMLENTENSGPGLIQNSPPTFVYKIIKVNGSFDIPPKISIDSVTGVLTFNPGLSPGEYIIQVLVGEIFMNLSPECENEPSPLYVNYNINFFRLTVERSDQRPNILKIILIIILLLFFVKLILCLCRNKKTK